MLSKDDKEKKVYHQMNECEIKVKKNLTRNGLVLGLTKKSKKKIIVIIFDDGICPDDDDKMYRIY